MVCSHYCYRREKPANDYISWNSSRERGSSPITSAFYATVIRPCSRILRYAITRSQAWTSGIDTKACQIHIIYAFTRGMSDSNIVFVAELTSLESRRDQLSRSFFQQSSVLFPLSFTPPPRDTSVLSRLRTATRFTRPISRNKNIVPLLITP